MENSQFVASVHKDYLPFVSLATDEELAQFVRAQICQASGCDVPELTGMAKALFDTHMALIQRLEESSRKKSEAGKRGGNPMLKQTQAEVKQRLSNDKPEDKPVSDTDTVTDTKEIPPLPPKGGKSRKAEIQEIWDSYIFSESVSIAVKSWGKYKREKGQEYKPQGLKSLLTQVQKNVEKYGEEAVVSVISESMAANWQGIAWDKLPKREGVNGAANRGSDQTSGVPPGGAGGARPTLGTVLE